LEQKDAQPKGLHGRAGHAQCPRILVKQLLHTPGCPPLDPHATPRHGNNTQVSDGSTPLPPAGHCCRTSRRSHGVPKAADDNTLHGCASAAAAPHLQVAVIGHRDQAVRVQLLAGQLVLDRHRAIHLLGQAEDHLRVLPGHRHSVHEGVSTDILPNRLLRLQRGRHGGAKSTQPTYAGAPGGRSQPWTRILTITNWPPVLTRSRTTRLSSVFPPPATILTALERLLP
jgi:hypothetical protein